MRLFVKQEVFAFTDKFYIKDEDDNNKYFVQGEFLSLGKRLHIYDMAGYEIAMVAQRLLTLLPKYDIVINGQVVACISKQLSFLTQEYILEDTNIVVQGDLFAMDFQLSDNGRVVMSLSKQWFSWGDSYVLDIYDPNYEIISLAVVLAIDAISHDGQRH